jgi:hypothetical protein
VCSTPQLPLVAGANLARHKLDASSHALPKPKDAPPPNFARRPYDDRRGRMVHRLTFPNGPSLVAEPLRLSADADHCAHYAEPRLIPPARVKHLYRVPASPALAAER